jgi:hypothetical protein
VIDLPPEQEALYALGWNLPRTELSVAGQLEYDRLKPAWEQDATRRAGLAGRHKVDRSGTTHTFRAMRGFHLVTGIVVVVFGIGILVADWAGLAYPSSSFARGDGGVSTWDDIWMAGLGLLAVWLGIRLLRTGVQISAGKMTYRGYFRTRTVDASEIHEITLQPKDDTGNGSRWIPLVGLTRGKGFWIQSFDCGPARKPPKPHLAAALDEVRALLGVRADDFGQPETRQGA